MSTMIARLTTIAVLALMLAACGGSGGGYGGSDSGGNGGGGNNPPPPTYSVGGSITNLGGTLVLQNNGGDDLSLAGGATTFAFTTRLARGSAYLISIKSQPAGQTCAVSANGSGTVADRDIATVEVRCTNNPPPPPPNRTIGGSVSGLTNASAGLTLQNNGGDNLAIAANGPFTFAATVADGGAYAVTISSQPSDRQCAVTDGSGMATQDITNVAVACVALPLAVTAGTPAAGDLNVQRGIAPTLTFSAPLDPASVTPNNVTLSNGLGNVAIKVEAAGNVLTVTPAQPLLPLSAYSLTITAAVTGAAGEHLPAAETRAFTTGDGSWSPTQTFTIPPALQTFNNPRIAADSAGTMLMVWPQTDGSFDRLLANQYTTDHGWETPIVISAPTATNSANPRIVANANGTAVVAWEQVDNGHFSIFARRHTQQSGWSATPDVLEHSDLTARDPSVAVDANGNAVTVWRQPDGVNTSDSIFASNFAAANGTWSSPTLLAAGAFALAPTVAMSASGEAIAAWPQFTGPRAPIWANRYTAGGWSGAVQIESDNLTGQEPQAGIDDLGRAWVVWLRPRNPDALDNIVANRWDQGWQLPRFVETHDAGNARMPTLAVNGKGDALMAWSQFEAIHDEILSRHFTSAGTPDPDEPFVSPTAFANELQIAIDAAGNGFAVWVETVNGHDDIWSSRYTPATRWQTPVRLDIQDTNALHPQIAVDGSGNAMAIWIQSDGTVLRIWSARFE